MNKFRQSAAGLGSQLREIWDFDGNGVALPASSSGVRVLTYDQVENKENSPNNFHVPAKRWVEFHGPVLANEQGAVFTTISPTCSPGTRPRFRGWGEASCKCRIFSVAGAARSPAPRLEMFERRHDGERQAAYRATRVARVQTARAEGQSIRAIAEQESVSVGQVHAT